MKIIVGEYFKTKHTLPEELDKLIEPYKKEEMYWYDADQLHVNAISTFRNNCVYLAEPIVKNLIQEKKSKKSQNLTCQGKKDYSWMGSYCALKSSCDRIGQWNTLRYIVGEAIWEYHMYSKEPINTLKFFIATDEESAKIFNISPDKVKSTAAIGLPKTFWENCGIKNP